MTETISQTIAKAGTWTGPSEPCALTYEARFLRRKLLHTDAGDPFLVDLPHTVSIDHGDAFECSDGRRISVVAAAEGLFEVTGDNLARIAWHIGNRHTPCQVEENRLLIQRDKVIGEMLVKVGATVREVTEPFTPEGGAYGHGRTHSHAH